MEKQMDEAERTAALKWGMSLLQFVEDARGALDPMRTNAASLCIGVLRAELEAVGAPRDEEDFPEPASTDAHGGAQ